LKWDNELFETHWREKRGGRIKSVLQKRTSTQRDLGEGRVSRKTINYKIGWSTKVKRKVKTWKREKSVRREKKQGKGSTKKKPLLQRKGEI